MKRYHQNDQELLALISEGSDEAIELMFEKYQPLIINRINKFQFDRNSYDDYLQEGRLVLYKAIKIYRSDLNKTFTRFFELLLEHHFIDLQRKVVKQQNNLLLNDQMVDDYLLVDDSPSGFSYEQLSLSKLSDSELKVFNHRYVEGQSVSQICQQLGLTPKQVYNTFSRIKVKLKI